MSEHIRTELDGPVAVVTLNRPEALNALDRGMLEELDGAFQALLGEPGLRAVILTGAGKAFVAGGDIRAMATLSPMEARAFSRYGQGVLDRIEAFPRPVLAAVNGYALGGGCELALACDLRIGSEAARLGLPETGLGVVPGFGGTQRMARLVGRSKAKYLMFTGEVLAADRALAWGLLDEVVPPGQLLERCQALAQIMASRAPQAVSQCKALVDQGLDIPLWQGQELESDRFAQCFGTRDQKEGMQAFLEKRPAVFRGE